MPRWPTNLHSTPQMDWEVLHFCAKSAHSSASAALMGPLGDFSSMGEARFCRDARGEVRVSGGSVP